MRRAARRAGVRDADRRRHRRGRARPARRPGRRRRGDPRSRSGRIAGLRDSKLLTARAARASSRVEIRDAARSPGRSRRPTSREIDTLNILQATMLAMRRAFEALRVAPERGAGSTATAARRSACPTRAIVKGDRDVAGRSRRRRSSPRPRATRCWSSSTASTRSTASRSTRATRRPSISRRSRGTDRARTTAASSRRWCSRRSISPARGATRRQLAAAPRQVPISA